MAGIPENVVAGQIGPFTWTATVAELEDGRFLLREVTIIASRPSEVVNLSFDTLKEAKKHAASFAASVVPPWRREGGDSHG